MSAKARVENARPGDPALPWTYFVALAGAPLIVGVMILLVTLAALVGYHPLWARTEMTVAEAAALRDTGLLVQFIERGRWDPNQRALVRPGILKSYAVQLTPLEAGVAARRAEVVRVLVKHGATVDPRTRQILRCLAVREEATDIVQYLDTLRAGAEPMVRCDDVPSPWEAPR